MPVENRYAFTDFSELKFNWSLNGHKGRLKPHLAPGAKGELEFPVPSGTAEGDHLPPGDLASGSVIDESSHPAWHVKNGRQPCPARPPARRAGATTARRSSSRARGLALVFDRAKGDFDPADPRHHVRRHFLPHPPRHAL